ncbi:D-Ala-D-Ala carboxypeptidase family metallohydrolase [Buttiauxella agrestis]|uniref:D-Ala-D-Ala carboxypeptidase family metallohydrolase n=1 Tax=Buttiauxella agrestis TaxID=82977 RepID=UPI003976DCEE
MDKQLTEHFKQSEFACHCGCGFNSISVELVEQLEELRAHFGQPITINCGCRCPEHNKAVNGAQASQHLIGTAADIVVKGKSPAVVADYIEHKYPDSHGIGRYKTFTHFDTRSKPGRWNG